MPYIKEVLRSELEPTSDARAFSPGDLNFQFTFLINMYLDTHGFSYNTMNDILGALEGAKLEFYRRVVAPYEDEKIAENGDVYGTE